MVERVPVLGTGFIELWDFSQANYNEESRIEAVTTVAAECWGTAPKDRVKLYERLKTESIGLPSSAFEFVRSWDLDIATSLRNHQDNVCDLDLIEMLGCDSYEEVEREYSHILKRRASEVATFRMRLPIFVIRQIVRHRSFSYQELSRRVPSKEPIEFWGIDGIRFNKYQLDIIIMDAYNQILERTGRPEIARAALPLGTMSNLWMQGDLNAWRGYFKLRVDKHAQEEHRDVAKAMLALIKEHQPSLYKNIEVS